MNVRHVKHSLWTYSSIGAYFTALAFGIRGKDRSEFSSDFSYNKYHFGCFGALVSGYGLMLSAKCKVPWFSGIFFLSTLANLTFPGIREGIYDMRN